VTNFNASAYSGKWFETKAYPADLAVVAPLKCVENRLKAIGTDSIEVYRSAYLKSDSTFVSLVNIATFSNGEGKLSYSFMNTRLPSFLLGYTQYVIGTDYANFTVVQQCTNYLLFHFQYVWAFSRNPIPSASTIQAINQTLAANNIAEKGMVETDQVNCAANRV
jgi:lipocalin